MVAKSFTEQNLPNYCDKLARIEPAFKNIVAKYGYPPFWSRPASFETVIHIILEQQVSLASALSALNKLKERLGNITPAALLALTDEEMKACYFSRQKIIYARHLAETIENGGLDIEALGDMEDAEASRLLLQIKGIGHWTVDVFLMMVLHRTDYFPTGDIALVNSMKTELNLPKETTKDFLLEYAEKWRPYRTIAAFLLWHVYLCKRNKYWSKEKEAAVVP